ncbi:MAG: 4-hydroxy-tetrahydrodipicolinate reductase [Clostridia bacterium]|nr:4-hydroxy-tetrahydrodipicolinate reductase [Clostridia bacterium]
MNVILVGYGRMNRMIEDMLIDQGHKIAGIVDFDFLSSPDEAPERADVVIDFSHADNLTKTLSFCARTHTPAVIGTTNLTDEHRQMLWEAAENAPILYSANYSLGVAVMKRAARMLYEALGEDFDIEIVETHHNKKADAPSGTAKALADAIDPEHTLPRVYGREGATGARKKEIGIHAVRGGTVAGEHRALFLGEDEILEIRHEAASRRIFAAGAVRASAGIIRKKPGLYSMEDILWEE